jgi:hypothetical protein
VRVGQLRQELGVLAFRLSLLAADELMFGADLPQMIFVVALEVRLVFLQGDRAPGEGSLAGVVRIGGAAGRCVGAGWKLGDRGTQLDVTETLKADGLVRLERLELG